jgi:hypothetical protein
VNAVKGAEPAFGFVYLMKSGKHYKIGRSNAVGRREYELVERIGKVRSHDHAALQQATVDSLTECVHSDLEGLCFPRKQRGR